MSIHINGIPNSKNNRQKNVSKKMNGNIYPSLTLSSHAQSFWHGFLNHLVNYCNTLLYFAFFSVFSCY